MQHVNGSASTSSFPHANCSPTVLWLMQPASHAPAAAADVKGEQVSFSKVPVWKKMLITVINLVLVTWSQILLENFSSAPKMPFITSKCGFCHNGYVLS